MNVRKPYRSIGERCAELRKLGLSAADARAQVVEEWEAIVAFREELLWVDSPVGRESR